MARRSRPSASASATAAPAARSSIYADPLTRALARGVPFDAAVTAVARRRKRSERQVLASLEGAGLCHMQRIGGEDVAVPTADAFSDVPRGGRSATAARAAEAAAWRSLVSWAVAAGAIPADELASAVGSRAHFVEAVGEAVLEGLFEGRRPAASPAKAAKAATSGTPASADRNDRDPSAGERVHAVVRPADVEPTQAERVQRIRDRGLTVRKHRAAA